MRPRTLEGMDHPPAVPSAVPAGVTPPHLPVLRARGVDDLLGYAFHVLGTEPRESILLVTLARARLRAVVRVDRPGRETPPAARHWAEAVAAVARRDAAADAVVCVSLTGRAGGLEPPGWWPPLVRALRDRGIPAREGWGVVAGHAARWPVEPGAGPGPLEEVDPRHSDLSLHLIGAGSVWGLRAGHRSVPTPAALDPAAPDRPHWTAARARPEAPGPWLAAWERVLDGGGLPERPAGRARLGAGLEHPARRDALLIAAAGAAADELPAAERAALLTGTRDPGPDWRRLDRLWDALRALAADAPAPCAAPALALAAWICWARGEGTAAGAHLDVARRLAPRDPLVGVLRRILDAGAVCAWAADPRRAWTPWDPQDPASGMRG